MAEQTTPVMTPPPHTAPEKKKKNKKIVKNVLLVLVILAVVAAAAWAIWYFVFTEHKDAAGEPIYDTAQIGSIVSTVRGGGSANAKDSASISLAADGVVQEVYITQGQVVNAGDPLYVVTSPAAEEALKAAQEALVTQQENLAKLQEEMNALQQSRNDLTIRAPTTASSPRWPRSIWAIPSPAALPSPRWWTTPGSSSPSITATPMRTTSMWARPPVSPSPPP